MKKNTRGPKIWSIDMCTTNLVSKSYRCVGRIESLLMQRKHKIISHHLDLSCSYAKSLERTKHSHIQNSDRSSYLISHSHKMCISVVLGVCCSLTLLDQSKHSFPDVCKSISHREKTLHRQHQTVTCEPTLSIEPTKKKKNANPTQQTVTHPSIH